MQDELTPFRGGESEALKRLRDSISDNVRFRHLQFFVPLVKALLCFVVS